MENYLEHHKNGLKININWDTLPEAKDSQVPVLLSKDGESVELTREEMKWLITNLRHYLELTQKPRTFIVITNDSMFEGQIGELVEEYSDSVKLQFGGTRLLRFSLNEVSEIL